MRLPVIPIHADAFLFFLESLSARMPQPIVDMNPQIL